VFFLGYSPFSWGQVYNPQPPPLSPSGGGQWEELIVWNSYAYYVGAIHELPLQLYEKIGIMGKYEYGTKNSVIYKLSVNPL